MSLSRFYFLANADYFALFQGTQEQWNNVWYVSTSFLAFGAVFYAVFGSGELQTWAVDKSSLDDATKPDSGGFTNSAVVLDEDIPTTKQSPLDAEETYDTKF